MNISGSCWGYVADNEISTKTGIDKNDFTIDYCILYGEEKQGCRSARSAFGD